VLLAHLLVDAVEVLLATDDMGDQVLLAELALDAVLDLGQHFLAVAADLLDDAFQYAVTQRIECLEAEILEFESNRVHAEALGDRRVDFERLAGDAPALLRVQRAEGAHVVQAIGEFDEDHADVVRHRHQHLLEVLCLRFRVGFEFDLRQLGQAIDDLGDFRPEFRTDALLRDQRVFDDVVQHGRDQGLVVHVHLGQDAGDFERMLYIGLTALARLPFMRIGAEAVGMPDLADLIRVQVGTHAATEVVDAQRRFCRDRVGDVALFGDFSGISAAERVGLVERQRGFDGLDRTHGAASCRGLGAVFRAWDRFGGL